MQRNWIGRSEGAEITFRTAGKGKGGEPDEVLVYTTRPDTIFGATYFVFAPEHPIAHQLATRADKQREYETFLDGVRRQTEVERLAMEANRRAFALEALAVNPLNGEKVPVLASEYVLMEYGTGAIMAVPAHDQRDFEFARQYELPVRVVIQPEGAEPLDDDTMTEAYEGEGRMVNSGPFDGTASAEGRRKVTEHLEQESIGYAEVQFRLRDWLISRQRYWGTPIPIVYCEGCGTIPVPEEDLPVELPQVVEFQPSGGATSPLATATEWVTTSCPQCGADARRETDTMDTFVDSAWYFLRYCDARNDDAPFTPEVVNAWMPVDQYTGGIEHAVMHLIYARFWMKVLRDMGMVSGSEPYKRLMNHGMITMGGKVMSKSLGNVVDPWEVLDTYGFEDYKIRLSLRDPDSDKFVADEVKWARAEYRYLIEIGARSDSTQPAQAKERLLIKAEIWAWEQGPTPRLEAKRALLQDDVIALDLGDAQASHVLVKLRAPRRIDGEEYSCGIQIDHDCSSTVGRAALASYSRRLRAEPFHP
jgi:leucyl-tRNA synthetase